MSFADIMGIFNITLLVFSIGCWLIVIRNLRRMK